MHTSAAWRRAYEDAPKRDTDFEIIWALRQLLRGIELPESFDCGLPHKLLQRLATQMANCRYGAVFFGLGLAQRSVGHKTVEALLKLVEDLTDQKIGLRSYGRVL